LYLVFKRTQVLHGLRMSAYKFSQQKHPLLDNKAQIIEKI